MSSIISGRRILYKASIGIYVMLLLVTVLFMAAKFAASPDTLQSGVSSVSSLDSDIDLDINTADLSESIIKQGKHLSAVKGRDIVIVIDAGHGGKDPGAVGPNGALEKDICLGIAVKLAALLEKETGFKPILVREGDQFISIIDRLKFALKNKADMVVSIHADAFTVKGVHGSSVLYHPRNKLERTRHLGKLVLNELGKMTKLHSRAVKQQAITVLAARKIPSIMVEAGFISNTSDAENLVRDSYQNKLARSIFVGIRKHFYSQPPQGAWVANMSERIRRKLSAHGETLKTTQLLELPVHF
jgi:N-acetylmuramoyl-L-alanine amidase